MASVDLVVVAELDVVDYSIDFSVDVEVDEPGTEVVELDIKELELDSEVPELE